jgi:hypothetical protein
MAKLDKMAILQRRFCSGPNPVARFLTVYIEECKSYGYIYLITTNTLAKFTHLFTARPSL